MRELVGGKNTIGRTAAVLKKPHKKRPNLTDLTYVFAEAVGLDADIGTVWLFIYWLLFIYSVSGIVEIELPRHCSQI